MKKAAVIEEFVMSCRVMGRRIEDEIVDLLGCDRSEILRASGKTGMGVPEILEAIVERVPAPVGDPDAPLQALIFDSVFNSYKGVIGYFKIVNGTLKKGDKVKFVNTGSEYDADEVGILRMDMEARPEVGCGNVGYICSGIKTSTEVKVGDTITHQTRPCDKAIAGFEEVKPMVFAGVYPIDPEDYEDLRASLEKLQLNDASLSFMPESSLALGFGFRCGFLGLLHMEIIQERLGREFNMDVITTVPNVSYKVFDKHGVETEIHNPSGMPDIMTIEHIEEPFIRATIITQTDFIGGGFHRNDLCGLDHVLQVADAAVVAVFSALRLFVFKIFGEITKAAGSFYVVDELMSKLKSAVIQLLLHFFNIFFCKFVVHILFSLKLLIIL